MLASRQYAVYYIPLCRAPGRIYPIPYGMTPTYTCIHKHACSCHSGFQGGLSGIKTLQDGPPRQDPRLLSLRLGHHYYCQYYYYVLTLARFLKSVVTKEDERSGSWKQQKKQHQLNTAYTEKKQKNKNTPGKRKKDINTRR